MLLLKLISPKTLPQKSKEWKFRHRCYKLLLQMLARSYAPGVIDDVVSVNGVEVSHSSRDEWFESELKRFGIDITPMLKKVPKVSLGKREYKRLGIYDWKDQLVVVHSKTKCSIIRDEGISLETNLDATMRTSSNDEGVLAIRIEERHLVSVSNDEAVTNGPKETPKEKPKTPEPPKKKHKIHIKDTDPPEGPRTAPTSTTVPSDETPQETFTQHIGFIENDIF